MLESDEEPMLLMQGNPRQIVTANRKALELFRKPIEDVESHRGGQVFDCLHSFSEAGCGKDVNCEPCEIRKAVVDTFETGNGHRGILAELQVKKGNATKKYVLQVSTERAGEHALVRIEQYRPAE